MIKFLHGLDCVLTQIEYLNNRVEDGYPAEDLKKSLTYLEYLITKYIRVDSE